jgi:nifR3 family TIM-barrel protein
MIDKGLNWGNVRLPSRFLLAPLAGYTTLAFRLAVREAGPPGLATTDLVNGRALLTRSRRTMELIQTCPEDRPVAVQLYGSVPEEMADAARWLQEYGVTSVDINMGCPVNKVTRGGGGSAMMCERDRTLDLVRRVVEAVKIPVSVKMRLGWDDQTLTAPFFAREFEQLGVAGITLHGRTREQGFGGTVNLDGIRRTVEAVQRIPVIGNGDVRSVEDARRMFQETGCHGIAIGRGALLNPWIFAQLKRWDETGDPGPGATYAARLEFMVRHFRMLVNHRGEHFASLTFRKVANWYCRVLRPGREVQQTLVMLDSLATFEQIVEGLRRHEAYGVEEEWQTGSLGIKVPSGPIEHW